MPISSVERVSGGWDQGATKTLTLAATPPAGRLLTCRFVSDVVLSAPSGWTRYGTYPGGSADVGVFARLADGTVNSITLVGSGDTVAVLDHWSGNVSTAIGDCKDQNAQANNSTSSGTTGATAQADELAVVVLGAGTNSTGTWSGWTNSFVEDADVQSPGGAGTEVSGGFASRILTATGAYSTAAVNTASTANKSGCIVTFKAATGGAPQTVTPAGIASTSVVGTPTVTPGAVTVAPAGIASTSVVGTVVLSPGPVTLAPAGIPSSSAVGVATVSEPGAQTISPAGIASTAAVGTPTVVPGPATLAPAGVGSVAAVGSPTLTAGPVTLAPAGIASTTTVGSPTLTAAGSGIAPAGIASKSAVGVATITPGPVVLAPASISSTAAVGSPTVTAGPVTLAPAGIPSSSAVGVATVTSNEILEEIQVAFSPGTIAGPARRVEQIAGPDVARDVDGPDTSRTVTGPGV